MNLLIGYGNSLRRDDGLGPYLAERLRHDREVITCTQLMPELAEPISQAERVVFLDAGIDETPGKVTSERVEPLLITGAFTHNVTPGSLVAAASGLYGASPPALLISITGASFDYGCDFSPAIQARLPEIVRLVDELTVSFLAADS